MTGAEIAVGNVQVNTFFNAESFHVRRKVDPGTETQACEIFQK